MSDVNKLREFAQQMDWEGGWSGITYHGHDGSGDDLLDRLLEEFEVALAKLDDRWTALNTAFDLEGYEEEEDEEEDEDE